MKGYQGEYGKRPTVEEQGWGNAIAAVLLMILGFAGGASLTAYIAYLMWP
jgi:hypothetical protein